MRRRLGDALAFVALLASDGRAEVAPGERITAATVGRIHDLTSPGLEWCVAHGFPITVGETRHVAWPRGYQDATERYASQVELAPDGLTVRNYVAGLPFPRLDPTDPYLAVKIMWNYNYKFLATDDVDVRNFDADTGTIAPGVPMTVERHFLLDHFRALFYTGRLYVDPKPERPNAHGYRAQQGLYPILEPFDLKGVGAVGNRYNDPAKADELGSTSRRTGG